MSSMQAKTAPLGAYQGTAFCLRNSEEQPPLDAVVVKVRVAVSFEVLVMLTGEVEPKLSVGGY
jgi:hypothetical protein